MIDFIKTHIIKKIDEQIKVKQSILKHDHFYYFNAPVMQKNRTIDRFTRYNPFDKNEVVATSWYNLDGGTLLSIYQKIKDNEFYIYKRVEGGKDMKMWIKKKITL